MLGAMEQRILQLIAGRARHRGIPEIDAAVDYIEELHNFIIANGLEYVLLEEMGSPPTLQDCVSNTFHESDETRL